MRVLLIVLCVLASGTNAAAAACPSIVYGFTTYRATPAVSAGMLAPVPCRPVTDSSGQPACLCPDGMPKPVAGLCRPSEVLASLPSFAPDTLFVSVPQVQGPNGRCVPNWAAAQPPVGDLGAHRAPPPLVPHPIVLQHGPAAPHVLSPPRPALPPPSSHGRD